MKRGYLNCITSQTDPVHYMKINDYYYTLSFRESNKVTFIEENNKLLANFVYEKNIENCQGPFEVERPKVSLSEYNEILNESTAKEMEAEVIEDINKITEFQAYSESNQFNYFPEGYIEEIVLIRYKEFK